MSNLRIAAQQALEFLDAEFGWSPGEAPRIDALRAALAQQDEPVLVQGELPPRYVARSPIQAEPVEPVAWWVVTFFGEITEKFQDKEEAENFYRAMQANYPQDAAHRKLIPLYTAPPQRKPLTEEEMLGIIDAELEGGSLLDVARAVERAHEIKE